MSITEFSNLHVHSEYSLLDGLGKPLAIFKKAKELGFKYIGITDHANMDGHVKFIKASEETGVKYIPGCELYIVDSIEEYRKAKGKNIKRTHLTSYALNNEGVTNLFRLLGKANSEDNFYKKPLLEWQNLIDFNTNGIYFGTACASGIARRDDRVKLIANFLNNISDKLFLEVMPHIYEDQITTNLNSLSLSQHFDLPLIATNDNHYINDNDYHHHEVLLAMQTKAKWSNPKRWKFQINGLYMRTADEMKEVFLKQGVFKENQIEKVLENTAIVVDRTDYTFKQQKVELPIVYQSKKQSDDEILEELVVNGFEERISKKNLSKKDNDIYCDRLEEELELISKQGFAGYFILVYDFVKWAKENDILIGPGRGSSGSSLVAYCIGITGVDPIQYDLLFARFISPARIDLPDIDLDFEDRKRYKIREYLEAKYNKENVAAISTFTEMNGRGALRDIARVFEVSLTDVNKAAKSIIPKGESDSKNISSIEEAFNTFEEGKEFYKKYPEVSEIAMAMEGTMKNTGIHAAGIVVSSKSLSSGEQGYAAHRKKTYAINWDKEDIEYMGLMKLDVLGLNILSVLSKCSEFVVANGGKKIDFYNMDDFTDEKILSEFNTGNTIGIFQFESLGIRKLLSENGVSKFKDIYDTNALFRPGPLRCVSGDTLIKTTKSWVRIDELDKMRPIFSSTYPCTKKHKYIKNYVNEVVCTGTKPVYSVEDSDTNIIKCTKEHKFFVKGRGWTELKDMSTEDYVLIIQKKDKHFRNGIMKRMIEGSKKTRFKKKHRPWNKGKSSKEWNPYGTYFLKANNKSNTKFRDNWYKAVFGDKDKKKKSVAKMTISMKKTFDKNTKRGRKIRKKISESLIEYYMKHPHLNENGINVSKPQREIYEAIKKWYPDAKLEYKVVLKSNKGNKGRKKGCFYILDIAIPKVKLNIEFDGNYWHKSPGTRVEPRDTLLKEKGWEIIRLTYKTYKKFIVDIKDMKFNNSIKYTKIKKIKYIGRRKVYDINALNQEYPNYIANRFIVHNSGMTQDYINRKHGREEYNIVHEKISSITKDTYGMILYQEQVMNMLYKLAGISWEVTDKVRKVIAKSKGVEEFEKFKSIFVEGCLKTSNIEASMANSIFNEMKYFGGYGFNLCFHGDTTVIRSSGNQYQSKEITIKELWDVQNSKTSHGKKFRRQGIQILQMDADGRIRPGKLKKIYQNGIQQTYVVKTKSNKSLIVTKNHKLLTDKGYKKIKDLFVKDKLIVIGKRENYNKNGKQCERAKGKTYKNKGKKGFLSGSDNPSWLDGRTRLFNDIKNKVILRSKGLCEICYSKNKGQRYEFSHKKTLEENNGDFSKYHSMENIWYLCNSCHKKYDYENGTRKKRWSKGYSTFADEIISIKKSVSSYMTYDVEMETSEHNLVANGIVSHNSHSVEYSAISWHCMYCKVYYPLEYMQALLSYTSKDKEMFQVYVDEALRLGIKIEFADINISESEEWKSHDNKLYIPFKAIKNVGEKASEELVKARNKKYDNKYDFINKINKRIINIRVRNSLEKAGVFRCWEKDYDNQDFLSMYDFTFIKEKQYATWNDFVDKSYSPNWYFGLITELKTKYKNNKDKISSKLNVSLEKAESLIGIYAYMRDINSLHKTLVFNMKMFYDFKHKIEQCEKKYVLIRSAQSEFNDTFVSDRFYDEDDFINCKVPLDIYRSEQPEYNFNNINGCVKCKLSEECNKAVQTEYNSNVVILGEAPGSEENNAKRLFVGAAGKLLFERLNSFGLDRNDVTIANCCKCWPSKSRIPTEKQMKTCTDNYLTKELKAINPILILALGNTALNFIKGTSSGIRDLSGKTEWNTRLNCWVTYCLHPASVLYHKSENNELFDESLKSFIKNISTIAGVHQDKWDDY